MKVAIIYYSVYGHILSMTEAIKAGIDKADIASEVTIFQVPETLSPEALDKMHAPPKASHPIATQETLTKYDAFIFGYPTRFGNLPAQVTEYLGQTGGLWAAGALNGKPVALFTSVSSSSGGQETTLRSFLPYVAHHGLVYIPLGYGPAFADLTNFEEVHGGSPYGAATLAGSDGSRQPSDLEKRIAYAQGKAFAISASKFIPTPEENTANASDSFAEPERITEKSTKEHTNEDARKSRYSQSKPTVSKETTSRCAKCTIM